MQAILEIQDKYDAWVYVYIVEPETLDIDYFCYESALVNKQKTVVHQTFSKYCSKVLRMKIQEHMREEIKKLLKDKSYNLGVAVVSYHEFFFTIRDLIDESLIYKLKEHTCSK